MNHHFERAFSLRSVVNYTDVIHYLRRKVVKVCRNGWTRAENDHKVSRSGALWKTVG